MKAPLNSFLEQMKALQQNFTSDAWQLGSSFLINLTEKFKQFNIPLDKQRSTFEGIFEFIEDYVENFEGLAKINYLETLRLLEAIGSPAEILQMMDLPFEISTKETLYDESSDRAQCTECGWFNELDSNYCDNCGALLFEGDIPASSRTALPQIFYKYPTGLSLGLSAVTLITIGLIQVLLIYFAYENIDIPLQSLVLIAISVMFIPSIPIGLILGRILESSKDQRWTIFAQLQSPAVSILFVYFLLLCVGIFEGIIVFLNNILTDWIEIITILLLVMIAPAVLCGLFLSYINNTLTFGSPNQVQESIDRGDELKSLIMELFEHPYILITLLSYLVLVMVNVAIATISISPFFPSSLSLDLVTYYLNLRSVVINMGPIAILSGLIGGYILTQLRDDRYLRRKRAITHLIGFQNKYSLGIISSLISLWLFFIFLPLSLSVEDITFVTVILFLVNFIGSFWLYKWNMSHQPIQIPHLTFLRKIKLIESTIYKNLRLVNILGIPLFTFIAIGLWGTTMTWTIFTFPGWVTLVVAGLLLLNGIFLIYAFSWKRINSVLHEN